MRKAAVAFLIIALSCLIVTVAVSVFRGSDVALLVSEIEIESAVQGEDGAVEIEFSLNKKGYYFSDYKIEVGKDDIEKDKTVYYVTFYASLGGGYEVNSDGFYTINLKVDEGALAVKQRDIIADSNILKLVWSDDTKETTEDKV
ncbi:MAG: hypothetical protein IKM53_02340 [Clostridia bacterium]|nr:hypothetical protein [Clostridia bacterium]